MTTPRVFGVNLPPAAWRKLAGALCAYVAVAGCGNLVSSKDLGGTYLGPIGISVSESGDPLILLMVCNEPVTEVEIVYGGDGPHKKSGENGHVGTWKAESPLDLGLHELNLVKPGAEWVAHSPESLSSPWSYIVNGYSDSPKAETDTVFAHSDEIADLTPDTVLVESDAVQTRSEFESRDCSIRLPKNLEKR